MKPSPTNEINAHAGSRTRGTSMGGLYVAATLHALLKMQIPDEVMFRLRVSACCCGVCVGSAAAFEMPGGPGFYGDGQTHAAACEVDTKQETVK